MKNEIRKLNDWVKNSKNIVFFGGAGVSTESGIPDFRSVDGLYSQKYEYPPETIISHSFFLRNPEYFYDFYRDKLLKTAEPNITHIRLAEWEKSGRLMAIVTQNIDGLHQKAGSKNVFELHGSIFRNYCTKCHKFFGFKYMKNSKGIPKCECGGTIKPDVVLYEEGLDDKVVSGAIEAISNADMLIIGGTSLVVYPAAGLIRYFRGDKLALINKSATDMDNLAGVVIRDNIGDVFSELIN